MEEEKEQVTGKWRKRAVNYTAERAGGCQREEERGPSDR